MAQINKLDSNSIFKSIPGQIDEPAPRYLFSKTKTEREFFNLHPWPKGREFTHVDRVYAQLTDEIWDENSSPLGNNVYAVLRDVAILHSQREKMPSQKLGQNLEELDDKIEEIRKIAPKNVYPLMSKCLYLLDILDSKGIETLNPQIKKYLENRMTGEPSAFKMAEETDISKSKQPNLETGSLSTLSKAMMAGFVLLGCALYGLSKKAPANAMVEMFLNESAVPSWALIQVLRDANLFRALNFHHVDFAKKRCSDLPEESLLTLASQKNGNDLLLDSLFQSQSWGAKDLFRAIQLLFKDGRHDVVERAALHKSLHASQMARRDLETLWNETAADPKGREILIEMGFAVPFLDEYMKATKLTVEFADAVVHDETLIGFLTEYKQDLRKPVEDGNSLFCRYAIQVPSPNLETFLKMKNLTDHDDLLITVYRMISSGRQEFLQSAINRGIIGPKDFSREEVIAMIRHFERRDDTPGAVKLILQLSKKEEKPQLENPKCSIEERPMSKSLAASPVESLRRLEDLSPLDWNSVFPAPQKTQEVQNGPVVELKPQHAKKVENGTCPAETAPRETVSPVSPVPPVAVAITPEKSAADGQNKTIPRYRVPFP